MSCLAFWMKRLARRTVLRAWLAQICELFALEVSTTTRKACQPRSSTSCALACLQHLRGCRCVEANITHVPPYFHEKNATYFKTVASLVKLCRMLSMQTCENACY